MLSVVSYREESAQNGLIAALVGFLGTVTAVRATSLVIAASVVVGVVLISIWGRFCIDGVFYHRLCHIVRKMLKMGRQRHSILLVFNRSPTLSLSL